MNPQVKICGITRIEDALVCEENNIDCIGFVFFEKSKRFISPEKAGLISKSVKNISKAGVFVDAEPEYILSAVENAGLDIVQLHGKEKPEFLKKLKRKSKFKIIKALYLNDFPHADSMKDYLGLADSFILEGEKKLLPGGNGVEWDYSKTAFYSKKSKIILAGGLSPENFKKAVNESFCAGFDMSSGVEISQGIKDTLKIEKIGKLKKELIIENTMNGRFF